MKIFVHLQVSELYLKDMGINNSRKPQQAITKCNSCIFLWPYTVDLTCTIIGTPQMVRAMNLGTWSHIVYHAEHQLCFVLCMIQILICIYLYVDLCIFTYTYIHLHETNINSMDTNFGYLMNSGREYWFDLFQDTCNMVTSVWCNVILLYIEREGDGARERERGANMIIIVPVAVHQWCHVTFRWLDHAKCHDILSNSLPKNMISPSVKKMDHTWR